MPFPYVTNNAFRCHLFLWFHLPLPLSLLHMCQLLTPIPCSLVPKLVFSNLNFLVLLFLMIFLNHLLINKLWLTLIGFVPCNLIMMLSYKTTPGHSLRYLLMQILLGASGSPNGSSTQMVLFNNTKLILLPKASISMKGMIFLTPSALFSNKLPFALFLRFLCLPTGLFIR